ncbi:MAG TPA: FliH/SctL family protein, partial [Oligoflexia bacterium]|nr:FliH/SctL family protein [Oligoflexia bacterium]
HERLAMVEQYALQLAVEISKKILGSAVELRPEYILEIIRSGLHNLGAAKPMKVRVSPQDYEFIEVVGLPADLTPQETGVQYVSDEAIKAGCVIETDFGEVNLELDQMWEQVKNSLYAVCK